MNRAFTVQIGRCGVRVLFALTALASVFSLPRLAHAGSYTITDLGGPYPNIPPGIPFMPAEVNDSGQVAGSWDFPIFRPGLYSGGTFTEYGVLDSPGTEGESGGAGINNSGQIVGWSAGGFITEVYHAFVTVGGVMTDIGALAPPGSDTFAEGINDAGQVVGFGYVGLFGEAGHAFLYSAGTLQDLGTLPGGDHSEASAINNAGQVVGMSNAGDGNYYGFLYEAGVMTSVGVLPGGTSSGATDINDSGQIVGGSNSHPFLYDGGMMGDLGLPAGATSAAASAINAAGQIVGNSDAGPFFYSGGTMHSLNSLIDPVSGWVLDTAVDISDTGYIVGMGTFGGESRGYLLTPVPEPSTLMIAIAGSLLLLVWAGRNCRLCASIQRV